MRALVVVASLLVAGTATAQPGATPPMTPTAPPFPAPAPTVMDRRFAISLELGPLGLTPEREGAEAVTFGYVELSGRWRIVRSFEIGMSIGGGGALADTVSTAALFLDARYRFMPEQPWNVFALVSLGAISAGSKDGGDEERQGRGALRLGVGVERRFGRWALDAQLRLVGVGHNTRYMPAELTPASELATSKLSGGALAIGGTFYF